MSEVTSLTPDHILQVGMGFWSSKTLLSAVELGIFSELAAGPKDRASLVSRAGLHPRSAEDFLDALVALGFLKRVGGMYSNTPEADQFLDRSKPSYVGGILEMSSARLYGHWASLTEGLRTGRQQNEGKDDPSISPFVYFYATRERLEVFLAGMTGVSHAANVAIAKKAPWGKYKTFVDIGAAQGDLAVQIALANPHLEGTGFDLAPIGPIFEDYVAANRVEDRVQFEPGDFFMQALPSGRDVITMGHILHDWNLEQKKMLVKKAYEALNPGGALVVYDAIIDEDRSKNALGLLMSLNMLIETPGGFDYTGSDCIAWMKEAGFKDAYVEHLMGPDSMVVGFK